MHRRWNSSDSATSIEGVVEAQQRERERAFSRVFDCYSDDVRQWFDAGFAKDRANARVRVLQVGRGVTFEREHAVEVEHVIALAIAGEVGILDGPDADGMRNLRLRGLVQLRVLLCDNCGSARDRFFEQRAQLDRAAGTAAQNLAIGTQHGAEATCCARAGPVSQPASRAT